MATRKVKRFNEQGYVEDDAVLSEAQNTKNAEDARNISAGTEKEPGWDTKGTEFGTEKEPGWDTKPAAKATPKPAAKAATKTESKPTTSATKSKGVDLGTSNAGYDTGAATKKEMYRDFSGKMREKAPETDRFKGVRESIGSGLKSAGEGIGNYLRGLGRSEEKHGTYVKDGKVVRYAKGGTTASKRADGIATKGKTRGKIC